MEKQATNRNIHSVEIPADAMTAILAAKFTARELTVILAVAALQPLEYRTAPKVIADLSGIYVRHARATLWSLVRGYIIIRRDDGIWFNWHHRTLWNLDLVKRTRRSLSANTRRQVLERDGHRCQYCGGEDGELQVDHIVPICRGGTNDTDNLVTACRPCNRAKSDKLLAEV